jgi:hypothetical protein
MLNIGRTDDRNDLAHLSDAEQKPDDERQG